MYSCFIDESHGLLYLPKTFDPDSCALGLDPKDPTLRNVQVVALGISLLELSFNKPVGLLQLLEDDLDGPEGFLTRKSTAIRLLREIRVRESLNYFNAMRRCIYCDFDIFECNFRESEFREKYFRGVVAPLQEDVNSMMSTRQPRRRK